MCGSKKWEKFAILDNDTEELALARAAKREFAKSGFRPAMHRYLELQEAESKRIYVDPAAIAANYVLIGEKDKAFQWLDKAAAEKSAFLNYLKPWPNYDSLRSDPRYAALLKRMGLPQ